MPLSLGLWRFFPSRQEGPLGLEAQDRSVFHSLWLVCADPTALPPSAHRHPSSEADELARGTLYLLLDISSGWKSTPHTQT